MIPRQSSRLAAAKRLPSFLTSPLPVQVLARSSPADKFLLVHTLKELGEVVGVTGDGTNDAPALKESDVGLAMGISGTEVSGSRPQLLLLLQIFETLQTRTVQLLPIPSRSLA